ncbi:MAG: DivIVA domain-containing protein [Bacilli bacterium]|nr:DivIVA domain-containing protein [Bacilli bacterium]
MYQDRISLTENDILEKDFKLDAKGYRPQEVDKYLDIIIKDYVEFKKIIHLKEQENKELQDENLELKQEVRSLKTKIEVLKENSNNGNNIDVLKRLSNLEKIIYNKED